MKKRWGHLNDDKIVRQVKKIEFIVLFSPKFDVGWPFFIFIFFSYTFLKGYNRNHGGHYLFKHTAGIRFSMDGNKGCRILFSWKYLTNYITNISYILRFSNYFLTIISFNYWKKNTEKNEKNTDAVAKSDAEEDNKLNFH